jgi:hypothetical protein
MKKKGQYDSEKFMALSEAQRQRIIAQLEEETPQQRLVRSRPLNAAERKRWRRFQQKLGRPRVGRGSQAVSVTIEKGLLLEADTFARRQGLSRSQLIAESLSDKMGRAA